MLILLLQAAAALENHDTLEHAIKPVEGEYKWHTLCAC
jgi:hypothetical protein